jgi:hypothetical protein
VLEVRDEFCYDTISSFSLFLLAFRSVSTFYCEKLACTSIFNFLTQWVLYIYCKKFKEHLGIPPEDLDNDNLSQNLYRWEGRMETRLSTATVDGQVRLVR